MLAYFMSCTKKKTLLTLNNENGAMLQMEKVPRAKMKFVWECITDRSC